MSVTQTQVLNELYKAYNSGEFTNDDNYRHKSFLVEKFTRYNMFKGLIDGATSETMFKEMDFDQGHMTFNDGYSDINIFKDVDSPSAIRFTIDSDYKIRMGFDSLRSFFMKTIKSSAGGMMPSKYVNYESLWNDIKAKYEQYIMPRQFDLDVFAAWEANVLAAQKIGTWADPTAYTFAKLLEDNGSLISNMHDNLLENNDNQMYFGNNNQVDTVNPAVICSTSLYRQMTRNFTIIDASVQDAANIAETGKLKNNTHNGITFYQHPELQLSRNTNFHDTTKNIEKVFMVLGEESLTFDHKVFPWVKTQDSFNGYKSYNLKIGAYGINAYKTARVAVAYVTTAAT